MFRAAAIFLLVAVSSFIPAADPDFRKVFGNDYMWAATWLKKNDKLIQRYADQFNIPARELKAIVFPELIRYNGLFNTIEIETLKFLYVREGKHYADFSVGYFQMKPSFAEMIEEDAWKADNRGMALENGWPKTDEDNETARSERVRRLSSVNHQLAYLCAFYRLCEKKFAGTRFHSPEQRVRLFATCYNAGYRRNYDELMAFQLKNNFFQYNYSAVSVYYLTHE